MWALVTNLAMIRGVKAISEEIKTIDKEYWIIIIMVIIYIYYVFYF